VHSYSIPLLEMCSKNKIDIDMRVGRQAGIDSEGIRYCKYYNDETMH